MHQAGDIRSFEETGMTMFTYQCASLALVARAYQKRPDAFQITLTCPGKIDAEQFIDFFKRGSSLVCNGQEHHYEKHVATPDGPKSLRMDRTQDILFIAEEDDFIRLDCVRYENGNAAAEKPALIVSAHRDNQSINPDDNDFTVCCAARDLPIIADDLAAFIGQMRRLDSHRPYSRAAAQKMLGSVTQDMARLFAVPSVA